jgi:hypothetical protein
MQASNRTGIKPETLKTLLRSVHDPRRLGGLTRALGIINRTPYGEAWKEFFQRDLGVLDLQDFFSSMLEEEAVAVLTYLGARMPDTTKDTVHETVRRLLAA